jgi:hypothetical protein
MWKEIDNVVGCSRLPKMSDKPNLPYCEAVIHESLRLGNIVPYSLPHKVSEDIYYKGYKIPKNAVIIPSLDSVVYDEQLFPDSHSFKPERFIDEHGKPWMTASQYGRLGLSDILGRREQPTTLSISFHILFWMSISFIRYNKAHLIVVAVVSVPATKRSAKIVSNCPAVNL